MTKGLRIHAALLAAVVAVGTQLVQASPVQAGGGCFGGATNGTGTTVEMTHMCFTPTVLRIKPGDSVTFINRDQMQHTVTGTAGLFGSYDVMAPGASATHQFATNGVYAYACILHPGMTGAVVVGDGTGPGLAAGAAPVVVSHAQAPAAAAKPAAPAAPQPPWALLIAVALLAGAGLGFLFGPRLRAPSAR
jgi:plastocyanin